MSVVGHDGRPWRKEPIERMGALLDSVPAPHGSYAEHRGRVTRGLHDLLSAMEDRVGTLRLEVSRWTPGCERLERLWERA